MAEAPAYKVEDRSLLLPFYRRLFVDPILPYLPKTLNPNSITHAGHALNFIGTATLLFLYPKQGWPFAFAMILLQLYLWCDNADGAHARRTGQCSALGEFLDHGLDLLNTTYIGFLTALALGASPIWWVTLAILIPLAAVATFWEQTQTGVYRLGMINQIEATTVLSTMLLSSAIFGTEALTRVSLWDVTLQLAILLWTTSTILFGIARGLVRVALKEGLHTTLPMIGPILLASAIMTAAASEACSTVAAVTIATAGNVYLGMRWLSSRLQQKKPQLDMTVVGFAAPLFMLSVWQEWMSPLPPSIGLGLAVLACFVFGIQAIWDARSGIHILMRIEQARRPALK